MFLCATALIGELLSVDAVLLHGVVSKWLTRKRLKTARLSFACNPAATLVLPPCYWCVAEFLWPRGKILVCAQQTYPRDVLASGIIMIHIPCLH